MTTQGTALGKGCSVEVCHAATAVGVGVGVDHRREGPVPGSGQAGRGRPNVVDAPWDSPNVYRCVTTDIDRIPGIIIDGFLDERSDCDTRGVSGRCRLRHGGCWHSPGAEEPQTFERWLGPVAHVDHVV